MLVPEIIATRSPACESADGTLEFVVRVRPENAGDLLKQWPIDKAVSISAQAQVGVPEAIKLSEFASAAISAPHKPPTQGINGAGGMDLSGFGVDTGPVGAGELFRARHLALISNSDFQLFAASVVDSPDPFHSPRQVAQDGLKKMMMLLPSNEERAKQFAALCEKYVGDVTIDLAE